MSAFPIGLSTPTPFSFGIFPAIFICVLFFSCRSGIENVTVAFREPEDPDSIPKAAWTGVTAGLHASFGSTDQRYRRNIPPSLYVSRVWNGTAWKGERSNIQMVLWASEDTKDVEVATTDLKMPDGHTIAAENLGVYLVRYVITDEFLGGYGYRDHDTIPAHLVADAFERTNVTDLPANSARPVWITLDVPDSTIPGDYQGAITVSHGNGKPMEFELNLSVQDMLLPPPDKWKYHLDLWLNPFAIARYHQLELWSEPFWEQLKPYAEMLAMAGQKTIMTCIIDYPWKELPVFDGYQSMVKRVKQSNGKWNYDYFIFDRYVEFMQACGITEQINCHTMFTWGDEYRYFSEDSARFVSIRVLPGSKEYNAFWVPFLKDFSAHLKEKGWIEKTCIAIDERNPELVRHVMALLKQQAPELKVAMSINEISPELNAAVYDISSIAYNPLDTALIRARVAKGFPTTFYTCVAPPEHPNNFTFSPPADAAWLGWYAAAQGYSGFLRYAFCSWTKDPLLDSRYVTWPAGDTYQIYPGPRSSIRFERLREGIQDYEKIRILREKFSSSPVQEDRLKLTKLGEYLSNFRIESLQRTPSEVWVNTGKKLLNELSGGASDPRTALESSASRSLD